jgi:biotin-(acetyl-CoA carboxylase) ligase
VLLETWFSGNVLKRTVFGVGINVSTAPVLSSVSDIAYEATPLEIHLESITYQFVLEAVIEAVDSYGTGEYAEFIADNRAILIRVAASG